MDFAVSGLTSGVIRWPAPAKLNLFLHITAQRADGLHELETLFQLIDLCDWLEIESRDDGLVTRPQGLAGVAEDQDLVVRAARLLQSHTGCGLGVEIKVEKHIPDGAGLGGGSSDAATVLLVLNRLWNLNVSVEELARLGLRLGADVPVFVQGRSAWAEGVGENLDHEAVPKGLEGKNYVVIFPNAHSSTAEIFADPELTRNTPPMTIARFQAGSGHNDLQPVVCRRCPPVSDALDWLSQQVSHLQGGSRMTGSGSSVFAAVDSYAHACDIVDQVPKHWQGFAVKGLSSSPLLEML